MSLSTATSSNVCTSSISSSLNFAQVEFSQHPQPSHLRYRERNGTCGPQERWKLTTRRISTLRRCSGMSCESCVVMSSHASRHFDQVLRPFFDPAGPYPMGQLFCESSAIIWLANHTPKMPDIILTTDKTKISRNGFTMAIDSFPAWYQSRLMAAKDLLCEVLCGFNFPSLEAILTQKLDPNNHKNWFFDDLTNVTPKYSFLTDPKNELLQFRTSLIGRILGDPEACDRFHFQDSDGRFRLKASEWISSNRRFSS
jgi:hypothetical protein